MKILSFLVRQSPRILVLSIVAGACSGSVSAFMMALISESIRRVTSPSQQLALAFAGVTLLVLLTNLIARLLLLRISTEAVLSMRMRLCRQMLGAPLQEIERNGTSKLMATLTEDVLAVSDTLAELPVLCINLTILAAGIAYMAWLSPSLAAAFAAVFLMGFVTYELIERRTRPHLAQGREQWDVLIGHYQALILGNKELKLHRKRGESFLEEGLMPTAQRMRKLALRWHTLFAIAAAYGQAFYFVIIGTVLFLAPQLGVTDAAVLTGFALTILYMNSPISSIVGLLPSFQRASVSLGKLEELGLSLESVQESRSNGKGDAGLPAFRELEASGLTYTYWCTGEDRPFTLGPVDLKIRRGELVFVTGGNGSGKSSFARLITGLYAPDEGLIRYNGVGVDDVLRDDYRQKFSCVFSDFYLFEVLFGLVSPELNARVEELLADLQLSRKVRLVDGRFSTTSLSAGQRKRLALLTAFVEDRDVYLFDEWAADQDPEFKHVFYTRILPDLKERGKTVIVISHDDHYYHVADRVLKFEDGMIAGEVQGRTLPSERLMARA